MFSGLTSDDEGEGVATGLVKDSSGAVGCHQKNRGGDSILLKRMEMACAYWQ